YDVFASRIASHGAVLDPAGIPITPSWANDASPAVVWDGSEYLVTWTNLMGLFAARVDTDGRVTPLGVLVASPGLIDSAIGWNGSNALIAFTVDDGHSLSLAGLMIDRDGHPIGSRFPLLDGAEGAAVASDGSAFLVAATQGLAICAI